MTPIPSIPTDSWRGSRHRLSTLHSAVGTVVVSAQHFAQHELAVAIGTILNTVELHMPRA